MKKSLSFVLLPVLLLVGWISSCSSTPEYAQLIPRDAVAVMCVDVEAAIERSELGEMKPLQDKMNQIVEASSFSADQRLLLKQLMADPKRVGIDFDRPLYFFLTPSQSKHEDEYLLGGVADKDDLLKCMAHLRTMGVCKGVKQVDNLHYVHLNDAFLVFTDDWFLLADILAESDEEKLRRVKELAQQTQGASIAAHPVFRKMHARDGFAHLFVPGSSMDYLLKKKRTVREGAVLKGMLPAQVSFADLSLLFDLVQRKGELTLVGELLPQTDAAKKAVEERTYSRPIVGTFEAYIPASAFLYGYSNIDGGKLFATTQKQLEQADSTGINDEQKARFEQVAQAIDGDVAFYVDVKRTDERFPEMGLFVQSKNARWVSMVKDVDKNGQMEETGKDQYKMAMRHDGPYLYFGQQGQKAYGVLSQATHPLQKAKESISVESGLYGYGRMNIARLRDSTFRQSLGLYLSREQHKIATTYIEQVDYVEWKQVSPTQAEVRFLLKHKDQPPMRCLVECVLAGWRIGD